MIRLIAVENDSADNDAEDLHSTMIRLIGHILLWW